MLKITFQDQIPDEIIPLTRKYEGIWNEDMAKFFLNLRIEEIEYYGINGGIIRIEVLGKLIKNILDIKKF